MGKSFDEMKTIFKKIVTRSTVHFIDGSTAGRMVKINAEEYQRLCELIGIEEKESWKAQKKSREPAQKKKAPEQPAKSPAVSSESSKKSERK